MAMVFFCHLYGLGCVSLPGVSLRMIQLYEQKQNDINKAQVNVVLSLAKVLGCDVEDLLE